jgi:hypothetical protein
MGNPQMMGRLSEEFRARTSPFHVLSDHIPRSGFLVWGIHLVAGLGSQFGG